MTPLRRRALARLPLTEDEIDGIHNNFGNTAQLRARVNTLCESHERLRAELQGSEIIRHEYEAEVERLQAIVDSLAARVAGQSELLTAKALRGNNPS